MRIVKRYPEPKSLLNNKKRWTTSLLNEIKRCAKTGQKVDNKFYDKYRKEDVKNTLSKMYSDLCCFCESELGVTDYSYIEHLKPKKSYPVLTFDWNNLNLVCGKCNTSKRDKYNIDDPILDPTDETIQIENHLSYEKMGYGIYRTPISARGGTTIEHTAINDDKLCQKRIELWTDIVKLILEINKNPNNPRNKVAIKYLEYLCKGKFGSMIEFYMKEYL